MSTLWDLTRIWQTLSPFGFSSESISITVPPPKREILFIRQASFSLRESVHWEHEDICTEWKTQKYLELASLALRDVSSSEQNFLRAHPVLQLGRNRN